MCVRRLLGPLAHQPSEQGRGAPPPCHPRRNGRDDRDETAGSSAGSRLPEQKAVRSRPHHQFTNHHRHPQGPKPIPSGSGLPPRSPPHLPHGGRSGTTPASASAADDLCGPPRRPPAWQRSILRHIPCKVDRVHISLVCEAWRNLISDVVEDEAQEDQPPHPHARALPCLIFPARSAPAPDPAVQVLCGCRVHHCLDLIPSWARCFGSYDGCWVFLHYGPARRHWLHNVRTSEDDVLPSLVVHHYNGYYPVVHNMTILAAALSSSPADDPSSSYDAVFIAASWLDPAPGTAAVDLPRRCVAFWRSGWPWAYKFGEPDVEDSEDVAYRDGSFYLLLTYGNHILVCTPVQSPEGGFSIQVEERRFSPGGHTSTYDRGIRDRYLVMSREEVLLVVRIVPALDQPTSEFRVFQATVRQMPDADADVFELLALHQFPWEWSELDTLDGRMLFLGHGCSRSYETGDYPGFEDCFYFFDDGRFYEEAMVFGGASNCSYPCRDNGRWSRGLVDLCFPAPAGPSNQSPPAWVLP